MKKIVCLFILCCVAISMFACQPETTTTTTSTTEPTTSSTVKPGPDVEDTVTKSEGVMTWEEYNAADLESEVTIIAVQFSDSFKRSMHRQDRNTGIQRVNIPLCHIRRHSSAAAGIHLAQLGDLPHHAGTLEKTADIPHCLQIGRAHV